MDNDDLLDAVLAAAREAGADFADAVLGERTSLSLSWRIISRIGVVWLRCCRWGLSALSW